MSSKLAEFQWRSQCDVLEQAIRGQQRDALMFWMLQHHDHGMSVQTMQFIHDVTAPIELSSGVGVIEAAKHVASTCTEAAITLRRGGNAAVFHQFSELVDLCTRYIQHLEQRPVR